MYFWRPYCQFSKKLFRATILQRTFQWNLPLVSNVFEKIIYDHRKCSQPAIVSVKHIQHPLFRILQKCQKECDSRRFISTILMDLSKVYDYLRHNLFIAKSEGSGLANGSLNFLLDQLTFRKQRTKVNSAYSKWSKIRRGIPQGSILGLILFNIFINDIFMIIEQSAICNFAEDNTLYLW